MEWADVGKRAARMETTGGENQPTAIEIESVEEKEVDPNLWVVTDTTKYMEKQQSQVQDGAVSSWVPSPQQPAQPMKKQKKVPWTSYKPDGFGSFFDTTAEIQHKVFVILDLFPNDLDQSKTALDVAIDPDEHLRYRRSNREVIRRKFDDYTDHLSDYDSLVDEEESEEEEGEESEDEDYGAVKWSKKRKLVDTTAPEDLPFKCPHCPRRFTRELYLKGHLVRHSDFKPYQCPHCKKTFGREHHLTSHMTHSHAAAMALEGDEGERGEAIVFKCSLCGEGYPRVSQLTTHIQVVHAADVSPPAPPTDPPLGEGPATEGVYSSSSSDEEAALLIREDDDAAEAGTEGEGGEGGGKSQAGPVFHCPYCPRTFSRQMYLDSHLFSHSEDRPHKCLLCGKGFSRVHHLKSHMTHRHPQAVVTNTTLATTPTPTPTPVEATFKCPCCRRSFKKDFHLKSHIYQKHRENKDAFEFLKQFTNKKRKNSSDHSFGGYPASMETEDKSPSDNKPTVHNSNSSNAGSVSSEGGHFDSGKAQNVENGLFEDPRGKDPSNNTELHNSTSNATDLSPVFEEGIVSSGMHAKVAASQPRAKENEDERPYKCPTCGQGFARKSFLGSHIYQKHNRRRASSTDSEQGRQSAAMGTAPKARLTTGEAPPATAKEVSTLVHIHPVKESSGRCRKVSSSTTISSDASDEDPSRDPLSSTPATPSGIYKCPHCHRRFTRKAHLVSHVVAHSDERPYKCPHCEKAYGTGYHLKSHITYCHRSVVDTPADTPPVNTPPTDTPPVNTLPADTPPVRTLPADTPPVNTLPADTPPADTPPADAPPSASDRVFPFRCGECNESFPEHSMLRKHFQSHSKTVFSETKSDPGPHGPIGSTTHSLFSLPIEGNNCPPPPPPPPPPPFPPPNEPGVVDSSSVSPHVEDGGDSGAWMDGEGITTVVASGRIAPLESAALPSSTVDDDKTDGGGKGKPIKCPHCPRTFTYAGHLSSHLVSHSSQRPFACTYCSKSFAQRHHLKSHITHRHGNRQDSAAPLDGAASTATQSNQPPTLSFSCVECGKAFAQKNHLASHVYHKHPHAHVRKSSSSSSSREGGASGRVGGASGKVGGGTVQVGGTVVKLGVSPVREGGAPSPGLKSPRELLGFMQSVTSGNQLADLDVGGRSLVENPFIRGSPSTLKNDQQHLSTTREVLTLQGGSRESPSARENPAMSEGLTGGGESRDRAEVKGSSSSKRRRLPVALGDHASPDVSESPQTACLPGGTPPTKNMADLGAALNSTHSMLPQQPVTFIGGIPIVQTSFPAAMGGVQKNSPVITGSSPGFYMISAPPLSVASHSVQRLSAQATGKRRGETGFTGDGDVLFGTTQLRPSPSHPTSGAPPSLHCTHCPRIFHHQAHLDAHQAAHRTSSAVRTRSGSGLLAPLSHDCHMDSGPGTAAPPLSTGYYMSPPHPVAVADDQSASVGYPISQTKAPTGSRPRLPEPKEEGVFSCQYCPLSFDVKSHLACHLVSHENSTSTSPAEKPYQCPQCTESYDSSRQLNMHMKKTHQAAVMQVVEKEKLFKCDECGKSFQQEHHLGVHVYLKHLTDEMLGITENGGTFPCAHCGRVFEYKHLLKSHMFHSHKGVGLRQPTSQSDLLANTTTAINTAA